MKVIDFVEIGRVPVKLFRQLADAVADIVGARYMIHKVRLDPEFSYISSRDQFNSTEMIARLVELKPEGAWRIVGITDSDLCIPILTFVFGEAQLGCCAAVVSMHRLHQRFYGLPSDPDLLFSRALKEILHELGHTFGLRHCPNYSCVMHSSTTVEEIDLKGDDFCSTCRRLVEASKAESLRAASS